ISHISIHPKFTERHWTNADHNAVLYHLKHPIKISENIQPVCLPLSAERFNKVEIFESSDRSVLYAGLQKGSPKNVVVYQNLTVQRHDKCLRRWVGFKINNVYENRFCATVDEGNAVMKCVWRDFGPASWIYGRYYLLGYANNYFSRNKSGRCHPGDVYYFSLWTDDTLAWIRDSDRCGPNNFACGKGDCIPLTRLCNRVVDCVGGNDENEIFCAQLYNCEAGQFQCGDKCIPMEKVKDGVVDCEGGEDELYFNEMDDLSLTESPAPDDNMISYIAPVLIVAALITSAVLFFVRKKLAARRQSISGMVKKDEFQFETGLICRGWLDLSGFHG
ncbi:Low-density lipoprotein receptor 2, partial [Folsomia candida]